MSKEKKIVIIGAGPGGLTAGMILAKRGFDVEIIEREKVPGGRNGQISKDGYHHDIGPTFLMMKFILDEMFKEAGEFVEDHLTFLRLEPMYRLLFNDLTMDMSDNPVTMRRVIAKNFPGEEEGFDKFLQKERHRFQKIFACLQKDYCSPGAFLNPVFLNAIPSIPVGQNLFDYLGNYFKSERLRLSFTFQAKYLGMSPWQCPAFFIILSYIEHRFGVFHVEGGLSKISEAMANVFIAKGGKLRLNTEVESILFTGHKATGVALKGGDSIMADEVIINADFSYAVANLFPDGLLKKYAPEKVAVKKHSCSTLMYYWGIDKEFNKHELEHHNIFFADNYKHSVDRIFADKSLGKDFSFYVRNASLNDDTLAPEGHSSLYVLVPTANNKSKIKWQDKVDSVREHIFKVMHDRAGIQHLANNIKSEVVITPNDWQDKLNVGFGATFNLAHNIGQMLYFRPHNRFEETENTWLVGGGTHPGSGLPTIYESGRITANLICDKYNRPYEAPLGIEDKFL